MEHEQIPVAAVLATAIAPSTNKITTQKRTAGPSVTVGASASSSSASTTKHHVVALDKPARRVLPEHEGRYKITLPSGTTKRSQEILAKKAMRKFFLFFFFKFNTFFYNFVCAHSLLGQQQ